MNASLINNDTVSGIVKLEIEKKDYEEQVEKNLRQYRKKANIPGFRTGMVPMGIIKKMYGKYVLTEEVNKLVSENLFKYIKENDIHVLGDPLPNETEQQQIDFDTQEHFEFYFDLAFAPALDPKLTKRDKLTRYTLIVDEEMINKQIEMYRKTFGSHNLADEVEEEDFVKGIATELEAKKPKEGGIVVEEAFLIPKHIKGKREQNKFIGAKLNQTIVFNPKKAYQGADVEISSLLQIDKEVASNLTTDFQFEIKEINRYTDAELDKELFDKVFEGENVETEEEFRGKLKASLTEQYLPQSDYKFMADVRKLLIKKVGDVKFADSILKRWLLATNEKMTPEQVEADYANVVEDLIYHLAKEKLIKEHDLTVEPSEVEEMAKRIVKEQFAQYGMLTVAGDMLDKYAKNMLANEETLPNIVARAKDEKFVQWMNEQVKVESKEVTQEEFEKLFT